MLRRLAMKVRLGGIVVFHKIDWAGLLPGRKASRGFGCSRT